MRSPSDDKVETTIALLAPVPMDLLEDAAQWKPGGEIAFGSRAGMVFAELEHARGGHRVVAYIYASHDPAGPRLPRVTWAAEYVGLEEAGPRGIHPDELTYRSPAARQDGIDYWLVFWHVVNLRSVPEREQREISNLRGLGRRSDFARAFEPEGPLLIEPL